MAGEQHNAGLKLVETNVRHTLGGEINFYNDDGAVAAFTCARLLQN